MQSIPEWLPTNCQHNWLPKLFSKIKEKDPAHLDLVFIQSVEGHFHEGSVRKLAQFLNIAEIDGSRGKNYDRLKDYDSSYFKRNLREIILEKYTAFLGTDDLTVVKRESIMEKIMRHYQIDSDKARRAVNVLTKFCRLIEMPISDSLRVDLKGREERHARDQKWKTGSQEKLQTSDEIRLTPRKVKRIARWIKSSRMEAGLDQKRLAVKLEVYPEQIEQWEKGIVTPTKDMLEHIAKILNVNLDPKIISGLKQWVLKRRGELGLTREELAKSAGLSTQTVRLIEIGEIENPTKITINGLEKTLGKMPSGLNQEVQEKRRAGEFDYYGPFPKKGWRERVEKEGKISCIYVWYDRKKRPLYVGQTDDLKRRFAQHEKFHVLFMSLTEYFAYVVVKDEEFRRKMESVMIKVFGDDALLNIQEKI